MFTLEFSRRFSMAHRLLSDPKSKCRTPHGHDEVVTVGLRPLRAMDVGGSNASASFELAKRRWHAWIDGQVDHALQLNIADPLVSYFRRCEPDQLERLMIFDGDPTTEALAMALWRKLTAFLGADGLYAPAFVRIQETPTNTVVFAPEAGELTGLDWMRGGWPDRPDDSINDLGLTPAAVGCVPPH